MSKTSRKSLLGTLGHQLLVVSGSSVMTLSFFLILPVIQAISADREDKYQLQTVDTAVIEPPPPPPEPEVEEEEPEPEEPPPPAAEAQPLDLAQLELALNPGLGGGLFAGDFSIDLSAVTGGSEGADALFGVSDLDQKPRKLYSPSPAPDAK
ncbi:MAG: hypothetical protein ACYSWX_05540, partial [Planctomycetota bacterium]